MFPDLLTKTVLSSCPSAKGIHNVYHVANIYICRNCRQSFKEVEGTLCSGHYYHLIPDSNIFKCRSCSLTIENSWVNPLIATSVLQTCSLTLLDILLVYFKNAINGNSQPINSNNKFLSKVMDDHGVLILNSAGYFLKDGYWVLNQLNCLVQVQLEVVTFMAFNNMDDVLVKYKYKMDEGSLKFAKMVGYEPGHFEGNQDFLKYLESIPFKSDYYTLGICPPSFYSKSSSEKVQNAYERCIKEDPRKIPEYFEALLEIAKTNSDLEMFAIMERSKGISTLTELKAAYSVLGESFDTLDVNILDNFRNDFSNIDQRRAALKVIAAARDSLVLSHFLETGEVLVNTQNDVQMNDSSHLL